MICCALLSLLIGSIIWAFKAVPIWSPHPAQLAIEWRLGDKGKTITKIDEKSFSMRARLKSFKYAANGLNLMLRTEHNCWIHFIATIFVVFCALSLKISPDDWRWIIIALSLVWIAETLNTALEQVGDVISPNLNKGIGVAKDIAAGAVLISATSAVFIGSLTFAPYLQEKFLYLSNLDFYICKAFQ